MMPTWTCGQCGARLYSASKTTAELTCPECGATLPEPDSEDIGRLADDSESERISESKS
jgi:tRNA(Ile2) C34 agmatinyltransferase TiaS